MFQFPAFTQTELDADPRLAAMVEDKQRLLDALRQIARLADDTRACKLAVMFVADQAVTERQREAAHYAMVQAANVRRGWKPATFREILGEPKYVHTTQDES